MRWVVGTVTALLLGALFAPSCALADGLVTIGLGSRGRPVEAMNHRGDLLVAWESSGRDARNPYELAGVVEVRFKPAGGSWQPIRSVHVPFNDSLDDGEIIQKADRALYRAKNEGRNRVVLYDSRIPGELPILALESQYDPA